MKSLKSLKTDLYSNVKIVKTNMLMVISLIYVWKFDKVAWDDITWNSLLVHACIHGCVDTMHSKCLRTYC